MIETRIELAGVDESRSLLGVRDQNLRKVRDACSVEIVARHDILQISGDADDVQRARGVFDEMLRRLRQGKTPVPGEIEQLLGERLMRHEITGKPLPSPIDASLRVEPRTAGQESYIQAMSRHEIVFGIGPAGTGKTYLAVAMALSALRTGQVRRIVLSRPAVEAGESLGFLPGDFQAKVNPYLRPLYDALWGILNRNQIQRYFEKDMIEVVPLAYMRGRTLDRAFIILDEAQNTTAGQMKMFLTRLGTGSRGVITGDITQTDLPTGQVSGLVDAARVLADIRPIAFCRLKSEDIVRHPLVQEIVDAYERSENPQSPGGNAPDDR